MKDEADGVAIEKFAGLKPKIDLFLVDDNTIRLKKGVTKLLIDVFVDLLIFLIDINLKKCVTELFLKILLC